MARLIVNGALGSTHKGVERTGCVGRRWTSRDHHHYSTVKISKDNEKSPGDLRRFAFIKTPVKYNQVILI